MAKSDKAGLQLAIRHMVSVAGKSFADVSREMGRVSRYVSVMLHEAVTPRLDVFVKIANACGYDVLLVGHGEGLRLSTEHAGNSKVAVERAYRAGEGGDGSLTLTPCPDDEGYWEYDWEDHYADGTVTRGPDSDRREGRA